MNYFLLLFPTVMWGTIGVFVSVIDFTSTQIALMRTVFGSATLIILYIIGKKKLDKEKLRQNLPKLIVAGTCMAFNWIALFEAFKLISVSVATVIYYLAPAMVMAASPFIFKEKLTANKVIGLCAALLGMGCVSLSAGIGEVSVLGLGIAFLGAVLYAIITMINKSIKTLSGYENAMVELTVAVIVLIPYNLFISREPWVMPDTISIASLVTIGVLHTGICYAMYYTAVQRVEAQTAAICSFSDPFTALFVSVIFLNESLTPIQIVGAILILGGAMIAELKRT